MRNRRVSATSIPARWAWLLVLLFLLASLGVAGAASADDDDDDGSDAEFVAGELVVKLDPRSGVTIEQVNATYDTRVKEPLLGSREIYLLDIGPDRDAATLEQQMELETPQWFEYVELNYVVELLEGGGRSFRAWGQSGSDASTNNDYAVENLNLSCAYDITSGAGSTVAVLDTGIDLDHPTFEGRLSDVRYDFARDAAEPWDRGYNKDTDGDGEVDEMVGHGTHVAGIVAFTAPQAKIMPLRVLDSNGRGNTFVVAEAINYAARNGADVVNMSFGMPVESDFLEDVIEDAADDSPYQVVFAAAAGNFDSTQKQYPAAEDDVIAVTSVGPEQTKSGFANYGAWVGVSAPGEDIRSAVPGGEYGNWSGTSMATPFVAGQAALIRSVAPEMEGEDIASLVQERARSIDQQNPGYAGLLGVKGHADVGMSLAYIAPDRGCGNPADYAG
jgi:subtilisin family serine protease